MINAFRFAFLKIAFLIALKIEFIKNFHNYLLKFYKIFNDIQVKRLRAKNAH